MHTNVGFATKVFQFWNRTNIISFLDKQGVFFVACSYEPILNFRERVFEFLEGSINSKFQQIKNHKYNMSEGYQIRDQSGVYYLTFTVVDWIDVFTRKRYRDLLLDSLIYCQKEKGLLVYAYVIMSNHMHCILASKEENLSNTVRDLKSYTSKAIIKSIAEEAESRKEWMIDRFKKKGKANSRNQSYQFWKQSNHPIELYTNDFIDQKVDYIHDNPVKNGLVEKAEDYVYSSAKNYAGEKGQLTLEKF